MRLTLFHRGPLPSNGGRQQKHLLRQAFHRQLRLIWRDPPFNRNTLYLTAEPAQGLLRRRPPYEFVPLVLAKHNAAVTLHVHMLRQGAPSGVVGKTGDIDNQMKTLLDALAIPPQGQLPKGQRPAEDEVPFFCLLEDDRLITDLIGCSRQANKTTTLYSSSTSRAAFVSTTIRLQRSFTVSAVPPYSNACLHRGDRMRHYLRFALLVSLLAIGGFGMTPNEPSPRTRMDQQVFTLGEWHVKEGHQALFVAAWKDLGAVFSSLQQPPTGKGLLVQSTTDPTLFYSFGPWRSLEDVAAMRTDPRAQAGIDKLRSLCVQATPGAFLVVAESP